jgi:hypothetical protein
MRRPLPPLCAVSADLRVSAIRIQAIQPKQETVATRELKPAREPTHRRLSQLRTSKLANPELFNEALAGLAENDFYLNC